MKFRSAASGAARAQLEVQIIDNGPGLDPAVADRVFEPFATTKAGGMGLGLTVAADIIARHDGRIEVDSAPGRTRFRILLPIDPEESAMSARILLADDDASLRFVLSQALSKEGYAVRATGNVATLAKWVRDGEGDLVLSATSTWARSACSTRCPRMRAARPELPVIVMSAQSTVATALSAAGAGAYDYVPKPFDLDDLMAAVRRALAGGPDAKTRAQASKAEKEERLPLIGRSPAMQEVYRVMARVAGTDLTVLIEGESGAGKERVARALHDHSRRAGGPFVTLSLAGAERDATWSRICSAPTGKLAQARRRHAVS